MQVSSTVGYAKRSGDLRRFIKDGKKIIISTVQKFPFILDEIGDEHRGRCFAIIIDEAHSSQGGRTASKMHMVLAEEPQYVTGNDEVTIEDKINRIMESRKMLKNSDKQNAKIELEKVLQRVRIDMVADQTERFKHFSDNPDFRKGLIELIFALTYQKQKASAA